MLVDILNSKIINEVHLHTAYHGAKRSSDAAGYELRRTVKEDRELLTGFIKEATSLIAIELKGLISRAESLPTEAGDLPDEAGAQLSPFPRQVIGIADDWSPPAPLQPAVTEAFLRFYIAYVTGRWYRLLFGRDGEGECGYADAPERLERIRAALVEGREFRDKEEEASRPRSRIARPRRLHPF